MSDGITHASPVRRFMGWLDTNLRIAAVRDMFSMVEVRRTELLVLTGLALAYAITDGIGLTMLLPVLRFAEDGEAALGAEGGALWEWAADLAESLGLPLTLGTLLLFAFIPVLLRQVTFYLNTWYSALVSNRITTRMRVDTYAKMMGADPDFFASRTQGELTGAVLSQTLVAGLAVIQVMKLFAVALQVAIYVAILSFLSLPLTVLAVAAGLAVSRLLQGSMVKTRDLGTTVASVAQHAYGAIVERIALARLVKMRAQEGQETDNVRAYSEDWATANVGIAKLSGTVEVTADPLLMLSAFVTLYLGISALGLELAELGMLLYVLTRLNSKVKEFNSTRQALSGNVAGIFVIRELTTEALAADTIKSGPRRFEGLREAIEFDDVWFEYPGADAATLHGVSARIEAGSFTAIVGRSGAGKSTFVELLPRLRDVTRGGVKYDGVDVREFELPTLRRSIGYLTQDPLLFNDTVRANLLYGVQGKVPDSDLNDALTAAHAAFVLDLPDGLDTRLGDRGVRFSGGERQRIALARVLLDQPALLILDEPTSALDSESERHVQDALAELHGSTTIIVIAHRLATVVAADQLLVLEGGRIAQSGVHSSLAAADGPYKQLFESQLLKG